MHATLALCLMMVGGPVAPGPESEIIDVPLISNMGSPTDMQELEWRTNTRLRRVLPRVPTLNTDDNPPVQGRVPPGRLAPPTDRNAQQKAQPMMPTSPTDPNNSFGGTPTGPMTGPSTAGTRPGYGGQAYGGQGGYNGQPTQPSRPTTYDPNSVSFGRSVSNMGAWGTQVNAPRATYTPRASDTLSSIYNNANMSNLGIQANPMLNASAGGAEKPFSDYQRPSGYSPWMSLYTTPTNNGTMSTYTSTIQPQIQQQQFNRQTSEQIQGVRNMIVSPQAGSTPGAMETPVNGAGMLNPNAVINYGYFPQR